MQRKITAYTILITLVLSMLSVEGYFTLMAQELPVSDYEKAIEEKYGIDIVDGSAPCGCTVNEKPEGEALRNVLVKIDTFYSNLPPKMMEMLLSYHESVGPLYIFLNTGSYSTGGGSLIGFGHNDLDINIDVNGAENMLGWYFASTFIMPGYLPSITFIENDDDSRSINRVMELCVPNFYWQVRDLVGDAYLNHDDLGKPLYDYNRVMSLLETIKIETQKQIDRGEFGRWDAIPSKALSTARDELDTTIAKAYNRLQWQLEAIIADILSNPESVSYKLSIAPESEYNKLVEFSYYLIKNNSYFKDGMNRYPVFSDEYVYQTPYFSNLETAQLTRSDVTVNGSPVAFEAYIIKGSNYFKLRDIAYMLSGTNSQYDVYWDLAEEKIKITTGKEYLVVGGEMITANKAESYMVTRKYSDLIINDIPVQLISYNINGNNYFKLRDLGTNLGFNVDWDPVHTRVIIESGN